MIKINNIFFIFGFFRNKKIKIVFYQVFKIIIFISKFTKLIIYYLHERAWNKIKWGQIEK